MVVDPIGPLPVPLVPIPLFDDCGGLLPAPPHVSETIVTVVTVKGWALLTLVSGVGPASAVLPVAAPVLDVEPLVEEPVDEPIPVLPVVLDVPGDGFVEVPLLGAVEDAVDPVLPLLLPLGVPVIVTI